MKGVLAYQCLIGGFPGDQEGVLSDVSFLEEFLYHLVPLICVFGNHFLEIYSFWFYYKLVLVVLFNLNQWHLGTRRQHFSRGTKLYLLLSRLETHLVLLNILRASYRGHRLLLK